MIEADIAENELDGVVCCACTPRSKWDVFKFGEKVQVERVSLREQCVWSYQEDPKFPGQMEIIAKDYTNMGITKLVNSNIPNPELPEAYKTVMVVGGGFTGMKAALNATALGYDVVLLEKDDTLGGKAATMYKSFPLGAPFSDREQEVGIDALIKEVEADAKIQVLTGATLESLAGAPAQYKATVSGTEYEIGAVVMATGWVPGKPEFLAPLGYGTSRMLSPPLSWKRWLPMAALRWLTAKPRPPWHSSSTPPFLWKASTMTLAAPLVQLLRTCLARKKRKLPLPPKKTKNVMFSSTRTKSLPSTWPTAPSCLPWLLLSRLTMFVSLLLMPLPTWSTIT